MRKYFTIALLWIALCTHGQYFTDYGSGYFNGLSWNPAYAGNKEALQISLLNRNQWQSIEGAPRSFYFAADAPLKNERVGVGMSVQQEHFGIHNYLKVEGYYSYTVPFNRGSLGFGLKVALENAGMKWSSITPMSAEDKVFDLPDQSFFMPNFGVGFLYSSEQFTLAGAMPFFLSMRESLQSTNRFELYNDAGLYNYVALLKYRLVNTDNFKMYPIYKIKYQSSTGSIHDVGVHANIADMIWLGVNYRTSNTFVSLIKIDINRQIHFIYTFEQAINELASIKANVHEIGLNYEFSYVIKAVNPRF